MALRTNDAICQKRTVAMPRMDVKAKSLSQRAPKMKKTPAWREVVAALPGRTVFVPKVSKPGASYAKCWERGTFGRGLAEVHSMLRQGVPRVGAGETGCGDMA